MDIITLALAKKFAREGITGLEGDVQAQLNDQLTKINDKVDELEYLSGSGTLVVYKNGEIADELKIKETSDVTFSAEKKPGFTWNITTISDADEDCKIGIVWSSKKLGEETDAPATLELIVNNTTRNRLDITDRDFELDIKKYLVLGNNEVKLKLVDSYRNTAIFSYSINMVSLKLESSFDESLSVTGNFVFPYTPYGNIEKTMHFEVDGAEVGTAVTSADGRQQSYTFDALSHGEHIIEVYFTINVNGKIVESNRLRYAIIALEEGNEETILASSFPVETTVGQYNVVNINYKVFSQNLTTPVTLTIKENSEVVYSADIIVDRTMQSWSYRAINKGSFIFSITAGSTTKEFTINVNENENNISAETDGLELYLTTEGRNNNEVHREEWKYENDSTTISANLQNFMFTSDGWQKDEDGNTVLRVLGNARVEIPFAAFNTDFARYGKTIEFEFASRDVMDYDTNLIECVSYKDDGTVSHGFTLTPQLATLKSVQTELQTQYKENEHVRVSFVIEPRTESRLIYIYINGIASGVIQYSSTDNFTHDSFIKIGSKYSTIDLYNIRVYNKPLNSTAILNNWIADTQNVEEMNSRVARNSIFKNGVISIDSLPDYLPRMIFTGEQLPSVKTEKDDGKKKLDITFIDPTGEHANFNAINVETSVQGTSSAGYPRKNYKISLKKSDVVYINGTVQTDGCTLEGGEELTSKLYPLFKDAIGANVFTLKTDYASSEGANNVELVKLYNDTCPYKSRPQREDPKVRQGIDGFPMVVFYRQTENDTPVFIGKYNFNNDKSTENVFGFIDGDESWEVLNNTSNRVLFKSDDFDSLFTDENGNSYPAWQNDFESRFPKDNDKYAKLLKPFVSWVKSTENDLGKFKREFDNWLDKDSTLFYYVFTEIFLMIDSRAKNMFPTRYMGDKWSFLPYDFDTALGINNEGALVFDFSLEDSDQVGDKDVYNGQNSVLWNNVKAAFPDEIREMYQRIRNNPIFNYDSIIEKFEEHQAIWGEAVFNEDAWYKYIEPFKTTNVNNLDMLLGSKAEQRKWWLYNRFRYLDSKYNAGDSLKDFITLRGYDKSDIEVTPYADIYASIKYGSYLNSVRAHRNQTYTIPCPLDSVNDTEIYIYSASQIKDIGDISGLKVGYADFSMATRLQNLKIGDSSPRYTNTNLETLTLGNNTLLKTLDVRNCTNLNNSIDMSGCLNIENVYFDGTKITGVVLPETGTVRVLHLPRTANSLVLKNQPNIEEFVLPTYSNLATLHIENCGSIITDKIVDMVNDMQSRGRVRLINLDITEDDDSRLLPFFNKLLSMGGIDEEGYNVAASESVSGVIRVKTASYALQQLINEFFKNVTLITENIAYTVSLYNDDGTVLVGSITTTDGEAYWGTAPEKPMTAQYRYEFLGWSHSIGGEVDENALTNITADRKLYAIFRAVVRTYNVNFYNRDTLLYTATNVPYGTNASYVGDTPIDEVNGCAFIGWKPEPNNITGPLDVFAEYEQPWIYENGVLTITGHSVVEANYASDSEVPWYNHRNSITQIIFDCEGVTRLGNRVFSGCSYVTSIDIPETVTSVGYNAFRDCSRLVLTDLPNSVESIGTYAFYSCSSIKLTTFPTALTEIGTEAFRYCAGLNNITLPQSLSTINRYAFANCSNLKTITFKGKPTSLNADTFTNSYAITEIKVPWSQGQVANAPWGSVTGKISYNSEV